MKPYLFIYALIAIISGTQILSAENTIKRGDATVNIIFDGDAECLPQLGAVIYASTPFDENNMSQEFKFESNDKGLTANIPLLTRESIAMVRITNPEGMPYGLRLINITQDKPLDITATYYAENDSMSFKMSNTDGLNRYSIGRDDMNGLSDIYTPYRTKLNIYINVSFPLLYFKDKTSTFFAHS